MAKAALVIMAAGIGSRFGGGIKQLEPVGPNGEIIMDYSIYDALAVGFDKVVFVIRRSLEREFKKVIGNRIEKIVEVSYVYQEKEDIPEPYKTKYANREKPWGTGQAILCCKEAVEEPFVVINADDYYGRESFRVAYEELMKQGVKSEKEQICMVGFKLGNTLSENGSVTRGICEANQQGILTHIVETKNIVKTASGTAICCDGNNEVLDSESLVSMNMWGVRPGFFSVLENGFNIFLKECEKEFECAEYLLPTVIGKLIETKQAEVRVLESNAQWFGVTYREDKEYVVQAVHKLIEAGMYPRVLF